MLVYHPLASHFLEGDAYLFPFWHVSFSILCLGLLHRSEMIACCYLETGNDTQSPQSNQAKRVLTLLDPASLFLWL